MPVGKFNQTKARERIAEEREEQGNGVQFFQLKDGKNRIRIIPPPPGSEDVFFRSGTHWNVGADKKAFNCPTAVDKNADCFLCEQVEKLSKGSEDDKEDADRIRAKKTWLYNVVDVSDTGKGVQVMAVGRMVHNQISDYLDDEDGDYGDITDLEEGFNLTIKKSGKGMKTKYEVNAVRNPSAVAPEIVELLEKEDPTDLSTVRPIASNAKMKAAYLGEDDEDEDDDDEEEEKTVRKSRKAAPKKAVEEDADDEDEEDDDDDAADEDDDSDDDAADEDDDSDDDEDEEDDDEDEEEEEEAPAPKKSTKRSLGSAIRTKRASRR